MEIKKHPVTPKGSGEIWWRPALLLFFNISGWIGFPVIIAVFLGQWLDKKYDTEPILFISTVIIGFIISMVGLITEGKKAAKKMQQKEDSPHTTDTYKHN